LEAGADALALPESIRDMSDRRLVGKSKDCAMWVNAWIEKGDLDRGVCKAMDAAAVRGTRI
jgi:hypothetical protein